MSLVCNDTEPVLPLTLNTGAAACENDITPVVLLYAKSPEALIAPRALPVV